MPRYSKLSTDDDADEDTVALMMGQQPPRLSRFSATSEYIQLEDMGDEDDEDDQRQSRYKKLHQKFQINTIESSRKLVRGIMLVAFTIVTVAMIVSVWKRHRAFEDDDDSVEVPQRDPPVLSEPLEKRKFSNGTHLFNRTTLMISLDGMHPHYIAADRTPNLHNLTQHGYAVPYMRPSFPTQTFPNHWTLITGMYPSNHGIVGNTFYDPDLDLEFVNVDPEKSLDRRFWGGEPIWMTAHKHGITSAVHMWPGSEAEWDEDKPQEVHKFDKEEPLPKKLDSILQWLDRAAPPELMLAYVPTVDTVGHKTGISGARLAEACQNVDEFIGGIIKGLAARNLTDIVNLVVVSDHGMAPTSNDRLVFLDDKVSNYDNITSNRGWPLAGLRFRSDEELKEAVDSAVDSRQDALNNKQSAPGYAVYRGRDDMPYRWHFGRIYDDDSKHRSKGKYNQRMAPMYIVPDPGYSLLTHKEWNEMGKDYYLKGVHGYDNDNAAMRATFLAQGPAFPSGMYASFDNVDVYSAICRSLGFPESKLSDGNFAGNKMTSKISRENYPGLGFETDYLKGTSFSKFYEDNASS